MKCQFDINDIVQRIDARWSHRIRRTTARQDGPTFWQQTIGSRSRLGDAVAETLEDVLEDGVWQCHRDAESDADYCLFHLPSTEKRDSEVRNRLLREIRTSTDTADPDVSKRNKQFIGCEFGTLDIENAIVGAEDNYWVDFRFATAERLKFAASIFENPFVAKGLFVSDEADLRSVRFTRSSYFTNAVFFDDCNASDAEFHSNTDFSGVVFEGGANFYKTLHLEEAWYCKALFGGSVDFRWTIFEDIAGFDDAEFRRRAEFASARFDGAVSFRSSEFAEEATFENTEFGGKSWFGNSVFGSDANFQFSSHSSDSDFSEAVFCGVCTFKRAFFEKGFSFERVNSSREAGHVLRSGSILSFERAVFEGTATFNEAHFHGETTFEWAVFEGTATFNEAHFHGETTFEATRFGESAWFKRSVFRADTGFQSARFAETCTFESTRFVDCVSFQSAVFGGVTYFDVDEKASGKSDTDDRRIGGPDASTSDDARSDDANEGDDTTATIFEKEVVFSDVEFRDVVSFKRARFHGPAAFDKPETVDDPVSPARFFSNVQFDAGRFSDTAEFSGVEFGGQTSFRDTSFLGETPRFTRSSFSTDVTFCPAEVRPTTDHGIDFTGSTIRAGTVRFPRDGPVLYDFSEGRLGEVSFDTETNEKNPLLYYRLLDTEYDGFDFIEYHGPLQELGWNLHSCIDEEYDLRRGALSLLQRTSWRLGRSGVGGKRSTFRQLETTYLRAKNGANGIDDTLAAGEFFRREKIYRRWSYVETIRTSAGFVSKLAPTYNWLGNFLLGLTTGHGERPRRVLLLSLVIIGLFSTLYWGFESTGMWTIEGESDAEVYVPRETHEFVLESVKSFLLNNPEDDWPLVVRLAVNVEGFLGAFFIGLWVFTLTRAIDR